VPSVVDSSTREHLTYVVGRSIDSMDMVAVPGGLVAERGAPC